MREALFVFLTLIYFNLYSLEFEQQIDNEYISVSRVKIFPKEEIGLHRDEYSQVVIAIQGGSITRLESDGRETNVEFPTNTPIFRERDPVGEQHKSINRSNQFIELIIIQLKKS